MVKKRTLWKDHFLLTFALLALASGLLVTAGQKLAGSALTPPPHPARLIDDGDPGFSAAPSNVWRSVRAAQGYGGDYLQQPIGRDVRPSQAQSLRWTFTVTPGTYKVQITYPSSSFFNIAVPIVIYDGATVVGQTAINQSIAPRDVTVNGKGWKELGTYTVASNQLIVQLKPPPGSGCYGFTCGRLVVGDAVRIELLPPASTCGNGVREGYEQCDDGNQDQTDACSNICEAARCGDNFVQTGVEECDSGSPNGSPTCSNTCKLITVLPPPPPPPPPTPQPPPPPPPTTVFPPPPSLPPPPPSPFCGNGSTDLGEGCDDGNHRPGDGCSAGCQQERCGDGFVTASLGEQCDDASTTDNDGCSAKCLYEYCSDGVIQTGEECDDGNVQPGDGCSSLCRREPSADVSVIVSAPPSMKRGETVTYTMAVQNAGPGRAENVRAGFYIPSKMELDSTRTDSACQQTEDAIGRLIMCSYPMLEVGELRTFVTLRESSPLDCGTTINHQASIYAQTIDPQPGNNISTPATQLQIICPVTATLSVAVHSIGTTNTVTNSQKDVTLLSFRTLSTGNAVSLNDLIFSAAQGSLANAENYALWADTDGDGRMDTKVATGVPANGLLHMAGNGFAIPTVGSFTFRFELHADIVASPPSTVLQLQFASDQSAFIAAKDATTSQDLVLSPPSAQPQPGTIVFTSTPSVVLTLQPAGSLYVSLLSNANPDPDGSSIPVSVAPIGQFKISVDTNGNIRNGLNKFVLNRLIFTVNATNVLLNPILSFYNKNNSSMKFPCKTKNAADGDVTKPFTGTVWILCDAQGQFVDTALSSGNAATFVLEAFIVNPKISLTQPSLLQVSLDTFSDRTQTTFGKNGSHFEWLNVDASASTPSLWVDYPDTIVRSTQYRG